MTVSQRVGSRNAKRSDAHLTSTSPDYGWGMSEHDELCGACGCPEARQDPSADFCPEHQQEVDSFRRWLDAPNEGCSSAAPSFDLERNYLSLWRRRPA